MLSKDEAETLVEYLHRRGFELTLLTNGLFIEKYPHLLKYFTNIEYHCVASLKDEIQFPNLEPLPNQSLDYVIVVTESEFHLLDDFIKKYPHINFFLKRGRDYDALSIKNFLQMMKKYRHMLKDEQLYENFQPCCNTTVIGRAKDYKKPPEKTL
jgi:hypothetical protein